jgi:hypothetical protein
MKPGADADTLTLFRASRNRKGSFTGIFARCTNRAAGFLYCAQDFALLVGTELLPVVKAKVDQPRMAQTGVSAQNPSMSVMANCDNNQVQNRRCRRFRLTSPVPLPTLVIPSRLQRRGICFAKLHRINAGRTRGDISFTKQ